MKFKAEIDIMPLKELLDPQGKAVAHGLQKMQFAGIDDVRVGKHITITLTADSKEKAQAEVEEACKKLLANPIMEGYHFSIHEVA
jgi:phosphoribosylformylglycinamidine synthase subunit PurS